MNGKMCEIPGMGLAAGNSLDPACSYLLLKGNKTLFNFRQKTN